VDKEEKEQFWAELEKQGVEPTREKLHLGQYGNRRKRYVTEWLRQKDQESLKTPWHKTWWGKAAIAILIFVVGAALVSRLGLN
jgi:hypothetical protein